MLMVGTPASTAPVERTARSGRPAPTPRTAPPKLEITPAAVKLDGPGEEARLYVTATFADGSTHDVTATAQFSVAGEGVQAMAGGKLRGKQPGAARVVVRFQGARAVLPVSVGSRIERPMSFRYDVLPILSRTGCNQGSCHGNGEGRGGLKLSLKGEDPDGDAEILLHHGGGRRINRMEPGRSLLLLKATSAVAHGGGIRFTESSPEYRAIARWIAEGAPVRAQDEPELIRLEVAPRQRVLVSPARMLRLTVSAHFSDGSARDVSHLAHYNTGDPNLELDGEGKITARQPTDAAVLVRYADQMQNVRVTVVPERKDFVWSAPPSGNWIDTVNFRWLRQLRLSPSRLTTDAEFVRRAYLDAIGRLPRPDETERFLADPSPDKRSRLIDELLQRPEFDDYWALKWSDVLRLEERSLDPKGGVGYRDWIRTSLAQRKPMDQFVRELLTASGSTYANPPANYFRRTRTPDDLAETTAQVFMGARLLCAKCHNHPFERWKQDDFFTLASFFSRIERKGELTRNDRFDKHELKGEETILVAGKGEYVKHPRTGKPMPPRLLTAAIPQPANRQPDGTTEPDPRIVFANWLTAPDNPFFARTLVNRLWGHLLGKGIVDPIDDLRESNPPSNPELLDALARDFVAHGFDMRHAIRTLMNSRTYQLSSEPNGTNADDERFFSRGLAQRLTAEVLLDALSDVTDAPENFRNAPAGTRAVQLPPPPVRNRHAFLTLFGQPQRESVCECERTSEPTLGQSFALISGDGIDAKLKRKDNRLGKLLAAGKTDAEILNEFYLAALCRPPSATELQGMHRYIASKSDRRAAMEDIIWALLNSKEFLLRR